VSRTGRERTKTRLIRFYAVAFLITLADQLSKYIVLRTLLEGESIAIIKNFFHLTLVYNTGVAFGFFAGHLNLLLIFISLSILFLFFFSFSLTGESLNRQLCFALILGGAIGNWIDRILFHAVIDFLDFRVWPVFNLADTAISLGVAFYLFFLFFEKDRSAFQKAEVSSIK
jgi:signal peptidase II